MKLLLGILRQDSLRYVIFEDTHTLSIWANYLGSNLDSEDKILLFFEKLSLPLHETSKYIDSFFSIPFDFCFIFDGTKWRRFCFRGVMDCPMVHKTKIENIENN